MRKDAFCMTAGKRRHAGHTATGYNTQPSLRQTAVATDCNCNQCVYTWFKIRFYLKINLKLGTGLHVLIKKNLLTLHLFFFFTPERTPTYSRTSRRSTKFALKEEQKEKDLLRMDAHVKIISATLALLAGIVTASCGGNNVPDDTRSDQMKAALTAVDESLSVNSPYAPEMIRHGLENASDSLDYYDWLLRHLRYRVLRGEPDTNFTHWRQTYGYLLKQGKSPRVNGMMAFLFNTQGSYYQKLHYKPEKAIKAYKNAYEKLIDSDSKHKMPDVCANLGDAYVFANDMPHAAMWYRRALFIADSLRLPAKDDVTLYMGLGRIYLNLQDFDSALNCYKRADKSFSLMSVNMQLYFLTNYGNYYYYAKDYKMAEAVFRRQEKLLAKKRHAGQL